MKSPVEFPSTFMLLESILMSCCMYEREGEGRYIEREGGGKGGEREVTL